MIDESTARAEIICANAPEGMLAELTHRCPLQCAYCSNPIELERVNHEMTTAEWKSVFTQAAEMGVLQIHLSGGEPTLRTDLEEIVAHTSALGLYSNLITAAVTIDRARLARLVDCGLDHVQISFQDADPENSNRIGNIKGGFDKKIAVAGWLAEMDVPLTVNAPMHRQNIDNLEAVIDLAERLGAIRLEVAHVQYYGWALKNRAALMPTYAQTMRSAEIVARAQERLKGIMGIDFVVPDYYALTPKPCMGGWASRFLNVTPSGKVLPCHAAESIAGLKFDNVRERRLRDIWMDSTAFNAFRGTEWMREPCRTCDRREIDFGGCRCQAFAVTGNAANADPACAKSSFNLGLVAMAEREAETAPPPFVYRRFQKAVV
ncbi:MULTISPECIES: pyrroloquinoline quinone biosynthesis protein PqqE [Rhodomicrobium]|uniref:pyrroloquinoline quinone biosynthesis protein PqqE n=1 Tax=Rhodomicrobium TaxID=1068 RepID=UPI000B4B6A21|nr:MULTISPECIES: pyrroloquinoline quinone biosynthesis protein PqqE [Rhodomicrobium]